MIPIEIIDYCFQLVLLENCFFRFLTFLDQKSTKIVKSYVKKDHQKIISLAPNSISNSVSNSLQTFDLQNDIRLRHTSNEIINKEIATILYLLRVFMIEHAIDFYQKHILQVQIVINNVPLDTKIRSEDPIYSLLSNR